MKQIKRSISSATKAKRQVLSQAFRAQRLFSHNRFSTSNFKFTVPTKTWLKKAIGSSPIKHFSEYTNAYAAPPSTTSAIALMKYGRRSFSGDVTSKKGQHFHLEGKPSELLPQIKRPHTHLPKIMTPEEAIRDVPDGARIAFGGFGLCGIPENLIQQLAASPVKNLTCVSDSAGVPDFGLGLLLQKKKVARLIASYVGNNPEAQRQYMKGEMALELRPQGTLAESLRCAGAGIPAFLTPTGVGTELAMKGGFPIRYDSSGQVVEATRPCPVVDIDGKDYLLEKALRTDFAFVRAKVADTHGNLIYSGTARNFNPPMATAATITIAEVEEIVEAGMIDPNQVHTPGIYVQRIVKPARFEKRIEKLRFENDNEPTLLQSPTDKAFTRLRIAKRASQEFSDGMYVNLGIGIPTLAANFLPPDIIVHVQTENGLLGMGPFPRFGLENADIINAGKETVTMLPGASLFSSDISFGMLRSDHLQLTMLGGFQVDSQANLSNWVVPGKKVNGPGGAMDLVAGDSRVVVLMNHEQGGQTKLVDKCSYPLTGIRCVDRVITDLAVFDMKPQPVLTEIYEHSSLDEVRAKTGFNFVTASDIKTFSD